MSFELVKLVHRIQTSKDHSFLSLNKQMFLFVKTKYLCYNFFDLSIEIFFLCLDRLLIERKEYFVPLTVVTGLVLTGALGITSVLRIGNNHATARLAVEVNGFLIAGTRCNEPSFPIAQQETCLLAQGGP
jgi:hypothetical protein